MKREEWMQERAGIAQLARASAFQAEGRGFESRFPLHISVQGEIVQSGRRAEGCSRAHVAQSVEHVLGKDEVTGSIPVVGSIHQGCAAGRLRELPLREE